MDNAFTEELFYLVTLPILSFIVHYFFSHCFVCRVESKLKLGLFYVLYFIGTVALRFSPFPGAVQLALNMGLIVGMSFLYRGNLKWRISAALFIVALIILSDAAMQPVYSSNGYILTLFLSKLLMVLLVFLLVRLIRSYGAGNLSGRYGMLLFLCPFLSVTGILSLSSNLAYRASPILFPVISSGLLIINFLIFILYDRVLSFQTAQTRNRLLEQQNKYYLNQYLQTKERQEEISKFRHDFQNILLGLRAKLQSGEEKAGLQEINKLLGGLEDGSGGCYTGNLIIDSIINYKQQVARVNQIPFHLDLNIPPHLELDTVAMSVILGNALDNAIEACKAEANVGRQINIHMHYLNQSLFISIQNPYVHEIHTNRKGDIVSAKSGNRGPHGLGLKNIKKIVTDCGGIIEISYNGQLFQIEIALFKIRRQEPQG